MSEYWRGIECFAAKASRRVASRPKTAVMVESSLAIMDLAKTSEMKLVPSMPQFSILICVSLEFDVCIGASVKVLNEKG